MTPEDDVRLISDFENRHPDLTTTLLANESPADEAVVVRVFDRDRPSTPKWEGQGETVQQALADIEAQMTSTSEDQPIQEEKEFLEEVYREIHQEE